MELFILKTPNIPMKIIDRGFLYFDKYKYRAKTIILGAYYARHKKNIGEVIKEIERVHSMYKFRRSYIEQINTQESLAILEKFILFMNSDLDIVCRIERENVSFYFNDPAIVDMISDFTQVNEFSTIAQHDHTEQYLVDPKHNFRTYIKPRKGISYQEAIKSFVEYSTNIKEVECSSTLLRVLNPNNHPFFAYRYYFFRNGYIEYNDEKMLSIIGLHFGPMVDYTVKLVKKERKKRQNITN